MIYQPRLTLDLRAALAAGIVRAAVKAATDFIAGENQGWTYYLGAALGYTAAATGIPYASATMFVTCEALDVVFFHSPEGSDVDLYVDGILTATIDTFTESGEVWESFGGIVLDGLRHRIDIVNTPSTNGDKISSVNWLGIGAITATGGAELIEERSVNMPQNLSFPILSQQNTKPKTALVHIDDGMTLADIQLLASALATPLDAMVGGVLQRPIVTIALDLPGGLKSTPVTGVNVRRGLNVGFSSVGLPDAVWFPAIKETVAPIDGDIALSQTELAALLAVMLDDDIGGSGAGLVTKAGDPLAAARYATVTFRK